MRASEALQDASRAMQVCNACRYCEGFCAVFPAMERRREFSPLDLAYLANLCHNCRACFYACQYAPPHPFNVNLPRTLTDLRAETWETYAWPGFLAGLFRRNGTVVALATALGIALLLLLTAVLRDPAVLYGVHTRPGAFYLLIPAWAMVSVASVTFTFSLLALVMGAVRFWRDTGSGPFPRPAAWGQALRDVASLRYLGGGDDGCNDRDEGFSQSRRWLHHALFYGFALCFASTTTAAFYEHVLGRLSPFPLTSLPVLLGVLGGLGMAVGTAGMLWLKIVSDPEPGAAPRLLGTEFAFVLLILLTAVTGLVLLGFRATSAMGTLLAIHLGCVLALFVVMPYSKFVHGVYRGAALLRNAAEARTASAAAAER